ncbi:MAG: hypothetical protein P0111_17025 [Nitrospira sp.]|nr:hypothetical protein [Nitrospira sp.]
MNLHSPSSISVTAWSRAVAMILVLALCMFTMAPQAGSQDAAPAPSSEGGSASGAGIGVLSGLSTILYLPFKTAFAIGGGLVGGLAYVFSGGNENAAKSIWTTSMYGTYVITPEHLRGDKPIRFLGVADSAETPPSSVVEPAR